MASKQQYVRQYNAFRGVDFTSDPVDVADYRVQYAVNMWRDYENNNGSMIETIPGYRKLPDLPYPDFKDSEELHIHNLNGLHQYRTTDADGNIIDYLIVHDARLLYYKKYDSDEEFKIMFSNNLEFFMSNSKSSSVITNNKLYIIDGSNIIAVQPSSDEDGNDILIAKTFDKIDFSEGTHTGQHTGTSAVLPKYEPTIAIDGEVYESPNILTPMVKEKFNNFVAPKIDEYEGKTTFQLIGISFIFKVTLGETEIKARKDERGYVFSPSSGVLEIFGYSADDFLNTPLVIEGEATGIRFSKSNKYPAFQDANESVDAKQAVLGCTSIAVFDGKIFLTGNPKHPNLIFFTSTAKDMGTNEPTYIGAYNWLNTGVGMTANRDMVASQGVLMVFKGDTVQDGSIYYLSPFNVEEEGIKNIVPRFYMPTEGTAGIGCIGGAINFMDDTVFISKRGLDAVGKQLTNLERSIVHRSTNVDRKLLAEDLKNIRMVEWKGYLVISVGGHMYLADSRATYVDSTGNMQYEWFYLEGVGHSSNLGDQYRYWSGELPTADSFKGDLSGISVKPNNNEEIIKGTLCTQGDGEKKVWYSQETDEKGDPVKYLCYIDDEKVTTDKTQFYPAIELCVINDVLYFATAFGKVYCFNTDKRGEIPESIYKDGKWLDSNYDSKEDFVGWIPQEYYSFDGLKYPSGIITKTDNVGVPYAVKNTINRSLVLRVGADPRTHSTITVEVLTDRQPTFDVVDRKESTESSFGMQDYEASSFDTYPFAFLTYREHKRKWIEKRYKIYNDAFCGILRLHSLSYRYEIGGNIK